MRPNRIIVGEVRSAEAIDMLQALNTGHDGSLSTGHANSPRDMLSRLETMVLMGMDLPAAGDPPADRLRPGPDRSSGQITGQEAEKVLRGDGGAWAIRTGRSSSRHCTGIEEEGMKDGETSGVLEPNVMNFLAGTSCWRQDITKREWLWIGGERQAQSPS